jgi:hypothetical protein
MKYTESDIIDYARSQVRHIGQQKGKRPVLVFMGGSCVATVFFVTTMIAEKLEKTGMDSGHAISFISGLACGVVGTLFLGASILAFLRMFSFLYGKDIEAYRLLIKWHDEKNISPK